MEALAIKYRPKRFTDITEQENIKKILKYQLDTKTTKNAYLFVGAAGTGKTTSARIFANEINNYKGVPTEIDAASNSGVDNVREIIDDSYNKPIDAEFKTYIIDECHMLAQGAWAAFLKLLEEPPKSAIYIFCTTDPQKIPNTILSRVQRYDFQRISLFGIVERLKYILFNEQATEAELKEFNERHGKYLDGSVEETDAITYIAKIADGGMRDAITLLDKCLSYSDKLDVKTVTEALGITGYEEMVELLKAIIDCKGEETILIIEKVHTSGKDLKQFMKQFLYFILDVKKYQYYNNFNHINIPQTFTAFLEEIRNEEILYILRDILLLQGKIKGEGNAKAMIEAELVVLCDSNLKEETAVD